MCTLDAPPVDVALPLLVRLPVDALAVRLRVRVPDVRAAVAHHPVDVRRRHLQRLRGGNRRLSAATSCILRPCKRLWLLATDRTAHDLLTTLGGHAKVPDKHRQATALLTRPQPKKAAYHDGGC